MELRHRFLECWWVVHKTMTIAINPPNVLMRQVTLQLVIMTMIVVTRRTRWLLTGMLLSLIWQGLWRLLHLVKYRHLPKSLFIWQALRVRNLVRLCCLARLQSLAVLRKLCPAVLQSLAVLCKLCLAVPRSLAVLHKLCLAVL